MSDSRFYYLISLGGHLLSVSICKVGRVHSEAHLKMRTQGQLRYLGDDPRGWSHRKEREGASGEGWSVGDSLSHWG